MLNTIGKRRTLWNLALIILTSLSSPDLLASPDQTQTILNAPDSLQASQNRLPKFFESNEVIDLTIKTDLPTVIRDRSKRYHPATLVGGDPSDHSREISVEVGSRGYTSLHACRFPHIRLKFKSENTANTVFENFKYLKFVTHCNRPDAGNSFENEQQGVLLQYLTYRMYSILTDYSFKVRLARMHYVDTTGTIEAFTKYALILEPIESIGARSSANSIDSDQVNNTGYSSNALNRDYTGLVAAFEFMVANGDWHMFVDGEVNFLNVHAIYNEKLKLLPIPYDLDRSGMCNGLFAFHSLDADGSTFPIVGDDTQTIRDIYLNYFANKSIYRFAFARILEKKQEILDLYKKNSNLYDKSFQDRTLGHLTRFYAAIFNSNDSMTNSSMPNSAPSPNQQNVIRPIGESHNSEFTMRNSHMPTTTWFQQAH